MNNSNSVARRPMNLARINTEKTKNRMARLESKNSTVFDIATRDVLMDVKSVSRTKNPITEQVKSVTRFLLVQRQRHERNLSKESVAQVELSVMRMFGKDFEEADELRMLIQKVVNDFVPMDDSKNATSLTEIHWDEEDE
jgi:hypothetical protein